MPFILKKLTQKYLNCLQRSWQLKGVRRGKRNESRKGDHKREKEKELLKEK